MDLRREGNLRTEVGAAGPPLDQTKGEGQTLRASQMPHHDQDALQPQHSHAATTNLPPHPCPGLPELCREMPVTLAEMTLALVSFSRPEHTSLFPPSTAQVLPWAPASDMAPAERKTRVAPQPGRRGDTEECHTARGGGFTCEGGHQHGLAVAGAQDGGDDIVHKALGDTDLQQGLGHRALGHVHKGLPAQRAQQLLQAGEGVAMGLVLVDPGGDRSRGHPVMPQHQGHPLSPTGCPTS